MARPSDLAKQAGCNDCTQSAAGILGKMGRIVEFDA
jgi:hypothetical protein